jgi:hypothetical protein
VQNKNGRDDILKEVNQNRKLRVLNINWNGYISK